MISYKIQSEIKSNKTKQMQATPENYVSHVSPSDVFWYFQRQTLMQLYGTFSTCNTHRHSHTPHRDIRKDTQTRRHTHKHQPQLSHADKAFVDHVLLPHSCIPMIILTKASEYCQEHTV